MDIRPFQPNTGGTIAVANATSATSPTAISDSADTVVLYNSSATATAYFRCSSIPNYGDAGSNASVPVPGTSGDFPVPPGLQIRISVGGGYKKFSVIASGADGTLYITPGRGN